MIESRFVHFLEQTFFPPGRNFLPGRSFPPWPVRTFLVYLVVACLLPAIIGATALFVHEYREGRAQLERDTLQTARALVQAVDNLILQAESLLRGLASADSLAQGDLARFHRQARRALEHAGQGTSLALVEASGRQVFDTAKEFGEPLPQHGNQEIIRRVFATGLPAASDLFFGGVSRRSIMVVGVPVVVKGKVAYALTISVLPEDFDEILRRQGIPSSWSGAILDSSGTIVAHARGEKQFEGHEATPDLLDGYLRSHDRSRNAISKDGVTNLAVFARSEVTNWGVAIGIPRQILEAPLVRRLGLLAAGIAVLFAMGLALAWFWGGLIARSFRALRVPALALGTGEFFALPSVHVHEAAEVGKAMDEAAELLRERTAALHESETLFKGLAATLPGFTFVADAAGKNTFVNAAFVAYTGMAYEALLGTGWMRALHPEDVLRVARIWKEAIAKGAPYHAEFRFRRHDGVYRWYLCRGTPIPDSEPGRIARWVGVSIDMDEHKRAEAEIQRLNADLERRVAERTAELMAANRELEGFTFAASHDLRGPLGRINSFSALLEQRFRERLDGDALVFLDFIRQNACRLTQLVENLLSHARVAQQDLELQPVDVAALTQAVLKDKALEIEKAGAEISLGIPSAGVLADPHALNQALDNILQNALKYSDPARRPLIRIGGQEIDGCFRLWVRDNGIGFDMAYHDRIFEIFRRLHPYGEYEGSGIGLALVKRAMERMGGKVWAESRPGQGACFFLELQAFREPASV